MSDTWVQGFEYRGKRVILVVNTLAEEEVVTFQGKGEVHYVDASTVTNASKNGIGRAEVAGTLTLKAFATAVIHLDN